MVYPGPSATAQPPRKKSGESGSSSDPEKDKRRKIERLYRGKNSEAKGTKRTSESIQLTPAAAIALETCVMSRRSLAGGGFCFALRVRHALLNPIKDFL